jgi:hypothetical protein
MYVLYAYVNVCVQKYCNIIGDYTVDSLCRNTRRIYFAILQLIISWVNACRFVNHSPGYLDINVLLYVVLSVTQEKSYDLSSVDEHCGGGGGGEQMDLVKRVRLQHCIM